MSKPFFQYIFYNFSYLNCNQPLKLMTLICLVQMLTFFHEGFNEVSAVFWEKNPCIIAGAIKIYLSGFPQPPAVK